MGADI